MMASPKNRIRFGVDNPVDSDGFYRYGSPAPNMRAGRYRRRVLRRREARVWRAEMRRDES